MSQGFARDYLVKATGETEIFKETVQVSPSGTSQDITGIPASIRVFYLCFKEIDLSGTEHLKIRLGTSGGFVSTGYLGSSTRTGTGASSEKDTTAIEVFVGGAAENCNGVLTFVLMDEATDTWACSGTLGSSDTTSITMHQGFTVALGGELTQLRVLSESANTFADGEINIVYESPDLQVSGIDTVAAGVTDVFVNGTKQASTSGTEITFTLPAGVTDFKLTAIDLSTNGTSDYLLQLGTSGGYKTSGYKGAGSSQSGGVLAANSSGFRFKVNVVATNTHSGVAHFVLHDSAANEWVVRSQLASDTGPTIDNMAGSATLSGEVTNVKLTTVGGTNTFDGGSVNIQYDNQDLDLGSGVISGSVVQTINTQTGASSNSTTTIPRDDTIPQNTEGFEVLTASITPTNSANKLKIEVSVLASHSAVGDIAAALFQDTTANSLAVSAHNSVADRLSNISFTHWMTAGTASSTTFKVRIGSQTAGTVRFNSLSTGRVYGGAASSSITITEYKV